MLCLISHYYANKIYWRIIEGDSTTAAANEWRQCSGSFLLVLQWRRRTVGPRSKIPPKIQKLVKLTGHTNASNSLTSFQYEVHTLVGNGNIVNLLNFAWKNSWNHIKLTYYFWRSYVIWNHCAVAVASSWSKEVGSIQEPRFSSSVIHDRFPQSSTIKHHPVWENYGAYRSSELSFSSLHLLLSQNPDFRSES